MRQIKSLFRISLAIFFCLVVALPAIPVWAAVGTISITPTSGPVGSEVSITGSGFTANSTYTVTFRATVVATGTISVTGTFSTTFIVPAYPRGASFVTVTTGYDTSYPVSFTVTPSLTPNLSSGQVGDLVSVNGNGFNASTTVSIYFDGNSVATALSDSTGSFSGATFNVPASVRGNHTLAASDGTGFSPNYTFTVVPKITVSPITQTVGSQIAVNGSGFAASLNVTFFIDGYPVTSSATVTNSSGSFFNSTITIPVLSRGSHTLMAYDDAANSATVTLNIKESITINPQSGTAGTNVAVTGYGFGASRTITITYNGVPVATSPATINSDANGSFTASFTVPSGVSGSYVVQVSDGTYSATATFTITAAANLSPTSGSVGSNIVINGVNFNAGATVIIRYDGVEIARVTTDSTGSFSATIKAPSSRGGDHTIAITDNVNTVTLTFTIVAAASLSQTSGYVGGSITVSGTGFTASGTVTVSYDNSRIAVGTTDANGAFVASFPIPSSQAGNHTITAADSVTTVKLTFTVLPTASLSPASGPVSSTVSVTGTGFNSGATITIKYENDQAALTTADSNGAFSANFKAPSSSTGSHTVTVTDGVNTATLTFAVVASANLNPASGNVGSNVAVTGAGFAPGRTVTVKYDNNQVAQATTDAKGAFSATFNAPASKGGDHLVTVSDGTSTVTATFAMDSMPPGVPALLLPADNTKADVLTTFTWTAVNDPSGVTYTLEVATDAAFSNVVLRKTGLTNPGYTVTEAEKLNSVSKERPYYWRVKAMDGASNESPWTTPRTFYIGFVLATWALYTIFGAAVVIAGLLGFRFGRRTR